MADRGNGGFKVDDPSGGRDLTRRLMRVVPIALGIGLAVGVPLAVWAGDWQIALAITLLSAAAGGFVAAAIEDGRVQRRIDRMRGRPPDARRPGRGVSSRPCARWRRAASRSACPAR